MVIRIKKKLYFKPRLCPGCGKICLLCRHYMSQRCKECHRQHKNEKKQHKRRKARRLGISKYTSNYRRRRKRLIKQHPYCALCGVETHLTVHHVGGGCEHYTVLCDDCHQAYERWNNIKKGRIWRTKKLTNGLSLWRNIMRRAQFHCRMFFCRIRLLPALERQEVRSVALNSARENITN